MVVHPLGDRQSLWHHVDVDQLLVAYRHRVEPDNRCFDPSTLSSPFVMYHSVKGFLAPAASYSGPDVGGCDFTV